MKSKKASFYSAGKNLVGEWDYDGICRKKRPLVILFHGLTNARKDCPLINETIKALIDNYYIVFRFDFFGSGESPGLLKDKTMNILLQNAYDAINYARSDLRVDSSRVGLWGRSIGGTIACLITRLPYIKVRVIASPAVIIEYNLKSKFNKLQVKELVLEKQGEKLPGTGKYKGPYQLSTQWYQSLRGIDFKITKNLQTLNKILILGTSQDQKVTLNDINKVKKYCYEPKKSIIYPTDHDFAGYKNQAVYQTVLWFNKYL